MSYQETIARCAGTSDPAMTGLLEVLMRTEHRTLDGLTLPQFRAAVRDAAAAAAELAESGWLAFTCDTYGIPVPAGLALGVSR